MGLFATGRKREIVFTGNFGVGAEMTVGPGGSTIYQDASRLGDPLSNTDPAGQYGMVFGGWAASVVCAAGPHIVGLDGSGQLEASLLLFIWYWDYVHSQWVSLGGYDPTTGLPIEYASTSNRADWTSTSGATASIDGSGTFKVTISEADEWIDNGAYPYPTDGYGFPEQPVLNAAKQIDHYGSSQQDGLYATGIQAYEQFPASGGTISFAITAGSLSYSGSLAAPAGDAIINGPYIYSYVAYGAAEANVYSGSGSRRCYFNGWSINGGPTFGAPGYVGTSPDGQIAYDATQGVDCTATASGSASANGTVANSASPPVTYDLSGRLRTFDLDYAGSLVLDALATNTWVGSGPSQPTAEQLTLAPSATATITQGWFEAWYAADGTIYPGVAEEQQIPVLCMLDATSLASATEDGRDWRCQMVGSTWPAYNLTKSASVEIDNCSALTNWTAGPHTTLTESGGVQIAASGGSGSATLAIPHAKRVWEGYRYLQVSGYYIPPTGDGSPPASIPLTVSIPYYVAGAPGATGIWDLAPTPTGAAYKLDLCCRQNETLSVDPVQSRFPIDSPGGYPVNNDPKDQYHLGWGLNWCDLLTIGGIPDGYTAVITDVSIVEGGSGEITLLAPFASLPLGWQSPTDYTYLQQYGLLSTDDRVSDWPALAMVTPTGPGATTFTWFGLSDLALFLGYVQGMTVTPQTAPTDGWHGFSQPAFTLGALGATWTPATDVWTDWIDAALPITVPAQDLWDTVQTYPGAGDIWTGPSGAYGAQTKLRLSKSLRGEAIGLAFDATNGDVPLSGLVIDTSLVSSPTTSQGTATTAIDGSYATASPYAFGNQSDQAQAMAGTKPSATYTQQNRLRKRVSWLSVGPILGSPWGYDVAKFLRHARCWVRTRDSHIMLGVASNLLPIGWNDIDTSYTGTWCRCKFRDLGESQPIGLMWGDGKNVYWAYTNDEGRTWNSEVTLMAGVIGDFEESASGVKWFFKIVENAGSTYDIWVQVMDSQLNVVKDWSITTLTGVDPTAISCKESVGDGGAWRIGVQYSSGGAITTKFAPDGLNFS